MVLFFSDARELQTWVDTINLIAANLSSPALPSAVGSQSKKFQRPLLPICHTKFNSREQLADLENRLIQLQSELETHMNKAPEKTAPKRLISEFAEKQSYLEFEVCR